MDCKWSAWCLVLSALAFRAACAEDSPAGTARRPSRDYSGRVQMHQMPAEVHIPESVPADKPALADRLQPGIKPGEMRTMDAFLSHGAQPQPPPSRRDREKERRSRNWIRLGTEGAELKDADKETREDKGWGWLANDVLDQQESERAKAEEEDQDFDLFLLPTERLLQSVSGQGGLPAPPFGSSVPTAGILTDTPASDARSMPVLDQHSDGGLDPVARMPSTRESSAARSPDRPALMPGTVAMQPLAGASPPPRMDSGPRDLLPQTAALLARPAELGSGVRLGGSAVAPGLSATMSSPLSSGQAGGPGPLSSWATPAAAPRSMFGSFDSVGGVSPGSPFSSFERDIAPATMPTAPAQPPSRPTVDFQGPSWRR